MATIEELIAEAREIEIMNDRKAQENYQRELRDQEQRELRSFEERLLPHVLEALGEVSADERDSWTRTVTLVFTANGAVITVRFDDGYYWMEGAKGACASVEATASPGEFTQSFLLALGKIIAPATPVSNASLAIA